MKMKHERATHEQLERYVSFYRENPEMRTGRNTPKSPQQIQNLWINLAEELNALRGPTRTPEKWKETLGVWKSQLRIRARRIKMSTRQTGSPPSLKPLGEFEKSALATLGLAVDGTSPGSYGLQSMDSPTSSQSREPSPSSQLSPAPSQSCPIIIGVTSIKSETENATVEEADVCCGERNRLINKLINKMEKREEYEEQRQRREEEQHREVMQALQNLTNSISELIQVLI